MTKVIKKFLPNPILRSKKWISTSVTEFDDKKELDFASAEYFVHNLISPVHFYSKLPKIAEDAIVVEIGPHPLFARVIKEVHKSCEYLPLMKKD